VYPLIKLFLFIVCYKVLEPYFGNCTVNDQIIALEEQKNEPDDGSNMHALTWLPADISLLIATVVEGTFGWIEGWIEAWLRVGSCYSGTRLQSSCLLSVFGRAVCRGTSLTVQTVQRQLQYPLVPHCPVRSTVHYS
jgi:hypothetical protein